ncbi:MAG: Cys-tRNA(Pro) deacylase [Clostridiales bacterium]|nr:Cys-tRNA(Pro) deacylase [Clostridiales bacterium]
MAKKIKTNAMRILDREKINYEVKTYEYDENDLSGTSAAEKMGVDPNRLFKTLVLRGEKRGIVVCIIPVNREINLKSFAAQIKDKKTEMIHVKELLGLTGYIRGGCSPVGMKKLYPTFIEKSCLDFETIGVSGGQRGVQIILSPSELIKAVKAEIIENP